MLGCAIAQTDPCLRLLYASGEFEVGGAQSFTSNLSSMIINYILECVYFARTMRKCALGVSAKCKDPDQ